jgi:NAD(P)-dependent dehydrogenase (short-subunit alcohol dehydrogenase family)
MQHLKDRVAVITGAASGIGLALAERCAAEGMRLVLADIEEPALSRAAESIRRAGAQVLARCVDVASAAEVEALADAAYRHFGAVHLVCNNAGVGGVGAPSWQQTLDTWRWVINVNLFGVIHGVRSFVPRMLASGQEGHIVNTASLAGLTSGPMISPYYATKHAVVALSESLSMELRMANAKISVSVLCPAFVKTKIAESDRNRPQSGDFGEWSGEFHAMVQAMVEQGIPAEVIADAVIGAVKEGRFWILTHPEYEASIRERVEGMLEGRAPKPLTEFAASHTQTPA